MVKVGDKIFYVFEGKRIQSWDESVVSHVHEDGAVTAVHPVMGRGMFTPNQYQVVTQSPELTDEELADLYRKSREEHLEYYAELIKRGYAIRAAAGDISITKTISIYL